MNELRMDELDTVNGGKISLVTDKGYIGLEVTIGGYGFATGRTEDRFAAA